MKIFLERACAFYIERYSFIKTSWSSDADYRLILGKVKRAREQLIGLENQCGVILGSDKGLIKISAPCNQQIRRYSNLKEPAAEVAKRGYIRCVSLLIKYSDGCLEGVLCFVNSEVGAQGGVSSNLASGSPIHFFRFCFYFYFYLSFLYFKLIYSCFILFRGIQYFYYNLCVTR